MRRSQWIVFVQVSILVLLFWGGTAAAQAATPRWLISNARTKTVALTLIAGWHGTNGGLNFDGYSDGQMKVVVPVGWKITVIYSNQNAASHSVIFVRYQRRIPVMGFTPAFPHAESADPMNGSAMNSKPQRFTFVANRAGTYRIVCGVPDHALSGMWDYFVVSPTTQKGFLVLDQ